MNHYTFRVFTHDDLPMIKRWLQSPENIQWWGDTESEYRSISEDLDNLHMHQWIVEHSNHPFAYIQAYEAHQWPQPHLEYLPQGTLVLDTFIGDSAMLGIGHGSQYLRAFATKLIDEGAPAIAIDPNADNIRAQRAYARAGFVFDRTASVEERLVFIMRYRP